MFLQLPLSLKPNLNSPKFTDSPSQAKQHLFILIQLYYFLTTVKLSMLKIVKINITLLLMLTHYFFLIFEEG